jgi:hypothetical protein
MKLEIEVVDFGDLDMRNCCSRSLCRERCLLPAVRKKLTRKGRAKSRFACPFLSGCGPFLFLIEAILRTIL